MIGIQLIQGSGGWRAIRLGKVTASRVADVIAKTKSGWGASRTNYAAELIAERLTGVPAEKFQSPAMHWGRETEAEARDAYSFYADADVVQVGFVSHPTIGDTGASPDGLVNDDGLLELKCPQTGTHIDILTGQFVPTKYITQIQWQLACTGRKWCDFASYDPRMPENMRLFVKRVHRDDEKIAELEREVIAFLQEVREKVAELQALYGGVEPAPHDADLLMAG